MIIVIIIIIPEVILVIILIKYNDNRRRSAAIPPTEVLPEPLPCSPAAETALLPPIRCSESWYSSACFRADPYLRASRLWELRNIRTGCSRYISCLRFLWEEFLFKWSPLNISRFVFLYIMYCPRNLIWKENPLSPHRNLKQETYRKVLLWNMLKLSKAVKRFETPNGQMALPMLLLLLVLPMPLPVVLPMPLPVVLPVVVLSVPPIASY